MAAETYHPAAMVPTVLPRAGPLGQSPSVETIDVIAASVLPPNSHLLNLAKGGNHARAKTQRNRDQQECHLGVGRRREQ
jgi:hypothetical protein